MTTYLVKIPCANDCGEFVTVKIKEFCSPSCRHQAKKRQGIDGIVNWDPEESVPLKTIKKMPGMIRDLQETIDMGKVLRQRLEQQKNNGA